MDICITGKTEGGDLARRIVKDDAFYFRAAPENAAESE